jgi:nucleoside-diphosphate-sugar epimerase
VSRTVLVTGAAGLIGSAVAAALRGRGAEVAAVARGDRELGVDVADRDIVASLFRSVRPHTVVHTAYLLADATGERLREAAEVNVLGFVNVLEACAAAGVHSLLYASSIAAGGAPPSTVYGLMKLLNERQAAASGLVPRHAGVRIVNVYGDLAGRGQTGWLSTAVRDALSGERAFVRLAADAEMSVVWSHDLGERLASVALRPEDEDWPAVVEGGGEAVSGESVGDALARAGAASVELGTDRYDYPSRVESPWLDAVAGAQVLPFASALERMRALRLSRGA